MLITCAGPGIVLDTGVIGVINLADGDHGLLSLASQGSVPAESLEIIHLSTAPHTWETEVGDGVVFFPGYPRGHWWSN